MPASRTLRGGAVDTRVSIPAFAKVNLTLDIIGRRPDGYHELRSIVAPLSLHDDITVSVSYSERDGLAGHAPSCGCIPPVSVEAVPDGVDCSMLCPPEKNLAAVAARAFFSRLPPSAPLLSAARVAICIVKRIPLSGGLGGGSADAAATLRALQVLAGERRLADGTLLDAAAETGSDVPALLCGGPVLMEGRGERVSPIRGVRLAPLPVLLANPGIQVSAAEAYAAFDRLPVEPGMAGRGISANVARPPVGQFETPEDYARLLSNDLERVMSASHPEIAATVRLLREAGAKAVLMAGSGPTVFAVSATPEEAERLAGVLPAGQWMCVSALRCA